MRNEKLQQFLKEYAGFLKEGIPWKDLGNVFIRSGSFPRGCVQVMSQDLNDEKSAPEIIATFHTVGMSCSMPISQRDIQLSNLLVESIKLLQKKEQEDGDA